MSTDLTVGPIGTHLRRQATPMALGLVAIISFDAVDLFFVSQLGEPQLAAMSFCFPVIWLLISFNIGLEAGFVIRRSPHRPDEKIQIKLKVQRSFYERSYLSAPS